MCSCVCACAVQVKDTTQGPNAPPGQASAVINVNLAPTSGYCVANPQNGTIFTQFTLSCFGWCVASLLRCFLFLVIRSFVSHLVCCLCMHAGPTQQIACRSATASRRAQTATPATHQCTCSPLPLLQIQQTRRSHRPSNRKTTINSLRQRSRMHTAASRSIISLFKFSRRPSPLPHNSQHCKTHCSKAQRTETLDNSRKPSSPLHLL